MKLTARHFDWFTEQLMTWELQAQGGTAIIDGSFRGLSGRVQQVVEMPFPDSRIADVANVLRRLKSKYDGKVDDSPRYSLTVVDQSEELKTEVLAGFHLSDDDKLDVDLFRSIWKPLARDVQRLMKIPNR